MLVGVDGPQITAHAEGRRRRDAVKAAVRAIDIWPKARVLVNSRESLWSLTPHEEVTHNIWNTLSHAEHQLESILSLPLDLNTISPGVSPIELYRLAQVKMRKGFYKSVQDDGFAAHTFCAAAACILQRVLRMKEEETFSHARWEGLGQVREELSTALIDAGQFMQNAHEHSQLHGDPVVAAQYYAKGLRLAERCQKTHKERIRRVHTRAAQLLAARQLRLRRWHKGLLRMRAEATLLASLDRAKERLYAPGGAYVQAAAPRFVENAHALDGTEEAAVPEEDELEDEPVEPIAKRPRHDPAEVPVATVPAAAAPLAAGQFAIAPPALVPPVAVPPTPAAPTVPLQPPHEAPPKWVSVALNLLPQGKLSVAAVKKQVIHAAQRDSAHPSAAFWVDVLVGCEERGVDDKRVLDLQEALDIDMAAM